MLVLKLIGLEDRIVYDGALAHDVANTANAASHTETGVDAHAQDGSSRTNLLVIADSVADITGLSRAIKNDAKVLYYNPDEISLEQLNNLINNALDGKKADHIGFVTKARPGALALTKGTEMSTDSLKAEAGNPRFLAFWEKVSENLVANGEISLFGSNIGHGTEGQTLINEIAGIVHSFGKDVTVFASDNTTGSSNLGGDWTLERSSDTQHSYSYSFFDDTLVKSWDHDLTTRSIDVLFVSSRVADASQILSAVKDDIMVIYYDPATTTLLKLSQDLNLILHGRQADSIGFLIDAGGSSFKLTDTAVVSANSLQSMEMQSFWRGIASHLTTEGAVNLLGCSIAQTPEGLMLVSRLGEVLQSADPFVTLNASNDLTGNEAVGGDWLLEYSSRPTGAVFDARLAYFDRGVLDGWNHLLATTITFTDFSNISAIQLNNNAATYGNPINSGGLQVLRLTDNLTYHAGSAFLTTAQNLANNASFSTFFSFRMQSTGGVGDPGGGIAGADGITFTVQTVSNTAGTAGGGLGYAGIPNSVAIEYDTHQNPSSEVINGNLVTFNDINGNHIGIDQGGSLISITQTSVATNMNNGAIWYTWIDYNGSTNLLEARLSTTNVRPVSATTSTIIDLVSVLGSTNAFVGFTGSTGGAYQEQDIISWTFTNDYQPIGGPPSISVNDVSLTEGNSGNKTFAFTVTRAGDTTSAISFNYATANNTATTADSDYTATSGSASIAAGATTTTINVTVIGDTKVETDESFFLNISGASTGTISDSQGIGTIQNDDAAPTISINDVSITEGNSGTKVMTFTVTKTGSLGTAVTFNYATADNTATTADSDYVAASGSGSIGAGSTTTTLAITINGDTFYELDETFFVNLSGASGGTISDSQGVGTILNDDASPVIAISDASITEGDSGTKLLNFTVTRTGSSKVAVTYNYATSNGTALTSDSDYVAASGSGSIAGGGASASSTISVTINGDIKYELSETFDLSLSAITGASVSDSIATGTIINDDSIPTLSVNDVSITEGNSGTKLLTFTVTRTGTTAFNAGFNYATANNTALTTDSDYVAATGAGSILAGGATGTATVSVTITGDSTFEADENFFLNLTNAANATFSDSQGIGTIVNDDASVVLSISDASITEGNSGTKLLTFTVTRTGTTGLDATFSYSTADSSATTADSDYVAASGTGTILSGGATGSTTISVTINGDVKFEGDDTFFVNLSNPTNATISNAQAIGTIVNDDAAPTITINDVSINEGNAGNTVFTFTVTRTGSTAFAVGYNYATANNTALVSDSDYTAASGSGTVSASGTTNTSTITVNVTGDTKFENNESFFLNLSGVTNATVSDSQGLGTVVNDDATPTLTINDVSITEGDSGTKNLTFTITRTGLTALAATFDYDTANGSATTTDNDYNVLSGSGSIAAGGATGTASVSVVIVGDTTFEPDESFFLNLSKSNNAAITDSQGVGTILNDDANVTLSVNDVSITEGNSGTKLLTFTVTRTGTTALDTSFSYATANGTATTGDSDYVSTSGTGTILAGGASGTTTVSITINGDIKFENDETFVLNLSSPVNATISDAQGVGTILNDDAAPTITIDDVAISEGNSGSTVFTFTVTRTGSTALTADFNYATADSTATTADGDYTSASGSGSLSAAGATATATITINVTGDLKFENNETFFVNLSGVTNATVTDSQGLGTIINDDAAPTITIDDVSVTEGDSGTKNLTFTITRTGLTALAATFDYATANGTATTADSDFTSASGTGSISAGGATGTTTVSIVLVGDIKYEADENFVLNLSNAGNASIGDSQGTGTILNDDALPTITINDVSITEGNSGTKNLTFTITRTGLTAFNTTLSYATADGTATTADSDYAASSGVNSIVIGSAGTTATTSLSIVVNGDLKFETDETFFVDLSNAQNAIISDSQGQGTILNDDAAPTLAISDVSVTEGNAGTKTFTFTVTRTGLSDVNATFDYATANGTATTADSDYAAASGSGTILGGGASGTATISVTVNGDTKFENDDTFFVNLSNVVNATVADGQGLGTIINDDTAPVITINDVSVTEGNAGTTLLTFTVTRTGSSDVAATFDYTTANGTATTANSDYVAATGSGSVAGGGASGTTTISITINGDLIFENDETLFVNLSNAANASIGDSQGLGTILNDDAAPVITVDNVSIAEGNSGTTNLTFTITRTGLTQLDAQVNYATANDTALTADADYVGKTGSVTIAAGGATATETVSVVLNGDTKFEPDETFFLNLASSTNSSIGDNQGIGTILNDDAQPSISINDVSVTEGNTGTKLLVFTVTLSNPSSEIITVDYTTADDSATTADPDYNAASGTLTFNSGVLSQQVSVVIVGDAILETDEAFFVNLSNATNATIADNQGIGTILNDENQSLITISDASITEGDAGTQLLNFTLTLDTPNVLPVSVNYSTADGTALTGDGDYVAASGLVTFDPLQTTQTISITINGDTKFEADDTFFINLSNAVNGTIDVSQAVGTILNDDSQPAISIDDVSHSEGDSGTTIYQFNVTLSNASAEAVTVDYTTANNSATVGDGDYAAISGTLTFAPGVTSQIVTVNVNGDTKFEPTESFFVNISNAANATISDAQGVGTIVNDDATPNIAINDVSAVEGNAGTKIYTFTVSLDRPSSQTITVNYTTNNGSATGADNDYLAASGALTFNSGETSKDVTVTVNGDIKFETDETFSVDLSGAANANISDNQGIGTILNDDVRPTITINDVSISEGDAGTQLLNFTLSLSNASAETVSVDYTSANGSATAADSDYLTTSGTASFNPDVLSQQVSVTINGDLKFEPNENFLINLTNAVNSSILDAQGVGTILNDDAVPNISINDVSVLETDSGTTLVILTVTIDRPSSQTITVDYSSTDNTATSADSDYVPGSGTLTFNPNDLTQQITLTVNGDTKFESDENFFVKLTNASNANINDGQGTVTVLNDDPIPSISINDVSVNEGNSGTTTLNFTVTLSNTSSGIVTVNYATADGTAKTADSDYLAVSGALTFNPGELTKTVSVTINGDTNFETNETFNVNLSTPANATISDSQGVGTILNDDAQPALSINDVSVSEGDSGTTILVFTVTLDRTSTQAVTVDYATGNGSATAADNDYIATNGTLTFNAGDLTQQITVTVNGDTKFEPNENLFINLTNASGASISDNQGQGTILNDDVLPSVISIDDVSVSEGNSGTKLLTFTIVLSNPSSQAISIDYSTADNSATVADNDYVATSGTLLFAAGETIKQISVTINGDTKFEANDNFFLNLSNPVNATITDNQGIGTIVNDDARPNITVGDTSVNEGNSGTANMVFTISLSNPSSETVSVNYSTSNGTATIADNDYLEAAGSVIFNPGELTKTVTATVNGDTTFESNEIFNLNLSGAVNGTVTDPLGAGTIINDDTAPAITIDNPTIDEGDSGTSTITFTVTLDHPSDQPVTVDYTTGDGTATTADNDYEPGTGTVTFNPGETTQTISVTVNGDNTYEPNENFFVQLSNPNGGTIADPEGEGTITNEDPIPSVVSVDNISVTEGDVGTKLLTFTVTLSNPSSQNISIDYATVDSSAKAADNDYVAASGTLLFTAGETSKQISVTINGDTKFESDESFFLNISNPVNASISDNQGIGTITNDDARPTITINDVTVNEGDSGTSLLTYTVSLSNASAETVSVNFNSSDGTATVGDSDYLATSGTLAFSENEVTKQISVTVNGDTKFEPTENVLMNLANAVNGTITDSQGVGTITNDDAQPNISINDVSANEGNDGQTTTIQFTVTLSNPSANTINVNYAANDGSATTTDNDYIDAAGTLVFNPGETTKVISVDVNGDTKFEPTENFFIDLASAINAAITDSQGVGTITNDDVRPGISINDVTVNEGPNGTTTAIFTVTLSNPSFETVSVDYATGDNTATVADNDYLGSSGTLNFAPGETTKQISITINGDTKFEVTENFFVNLTNAINASSITDPQGVGTITNDDVRPNISINDVSVDEGDSGTSHAVFTVTLSNPSDEVITVQVDTSNGIAEDTSDYNAVHQTITFNPGETTKTVDVTVNSDISSEPNENFFVNLSNPTNATISDNKGEGTIVNDDVTAFFSVNDASIEIVPNVPNQVTFVITLNTPRPFTTTVDYSTQDGTATSFIDYLPTSGTLVFAPNETSKTVVVDVNSGSEGSLNFFLNLANPQNTFIADSQGLALINRPSVVVLPPNTPPSNNPTHVAATFINNQGLPVITSISNDDNLYEGVDFSAELPNIIVTPGELEANFCDIGECPLPELNGSFDVYLTEKPKAPVTIEFEAEKIPNGEIQLEPKSVTFTPDNWNIVQKIHVKVPEGSDLKGMDSIHIVPKPATSADPIYDGYIAASVDLSIPKEYKEGVKPSQNNAKETPQPQKQEPKN